MDKTFLKDKRLSWKAKGILAYMRSMPDNWTFYIDELIQHSTDGESSFRTGLNELKKHGYVKRYPVRENNKIARWETLVLENPLLGDFQQVGNLDVEKLDVENQALLNNNNTNNKNTNKNSSNAFEFYQQNFGVISPFVAEKINGWIDDLSEELVIEAMKKTLTANKQFNYTEGILKEWYRTNVKTIDDVKTKEKEFKKTTPKKKKIDWDDL